MPAITVQVSDAAAQILEEKGLDGHLELDAALLRGVMAWKAERLSEQLNAWALKEPEDSPVELAREILNLAEAIEEIDGEQKGSS